MKIKELLKKFDRIKYAKMIEIFSQSNEYNLQRAYLCQLIMLSFLEENGLIENIEYYEESLTELLKEVKIETESDIDKTFFKLYDRECMVRYLHFSYNIKMMKLDHKWINTFSDFIYHWFCNIFFNDAIGLSKKDLIKILNTEI